LTISLKLEVAKGFKLFHISLSQISFVQLGYKNRFSKKQSMLKVNFLEKERERETTLAF
jgi:hypothetical protein